MNDELKNLDDIIGRLYEIVRGRLTTSEHALLEKLLMKLSNDEIYQSIAGSVDIEDNKELINDFETDSRGVGI